MRFLTCQKASNFHHSPLREGLGLHLGITQLCRSETWAQFSPATRLRIRLAASTTLTC